ncbi:MAG: hypothetical protein GXX91_03230 [Verrucomicrobiaceae bacterium]|nr:hypothetical protein [Verrucomicrobiaceae bacterium]
MSSAQPPSSPESARTLEPVPPAAAPYMASYRKGRSLIVLNGASLPCEYCIKTGRPAVKTVEIALRNPANPLTWFGRRPRLEVGLSRKPLDNHRVAVALTWSVLAIGGLMLVTGIASRSLFAAGIGGVAMAVSGLFRALSPVTSRSASPDYLEVDGAGEAFLKHLPESP